MEPSPLTQVSRPELFQPKIISLYETLFKVRACRLNGVIVAHHKQEDEEDVELTKGFWQEFFLHRPDSAGLKRILGAISPDEMLHRQAHSQQLFRRAIHTVKQAKPPADEVALEVRTRRTL